MNYNLSNVLEGVREHIKKQFGPEIVAHDANHLLRVEKNAYELSIKMGVDPAIPCLAALLHDYHRMAEVELNRYVTPEETKGRVNKILDEFGVTNSTKDHIVRCIDFTEKFRCAGDDIDQNKYSLEEKIVRDADILDALGAIGIARAFMFGGKLGEPMWVSGKGSERFVPGKTKSVVHHFYEKLLNLGDEMMTIPGREMALKRITYMNMFLEEMKAELKVHDLIYNIELELQ